MKKICLNGYWDFQPIFETDENTHVPEQGWEEGAFMVPSVWTKSKHGYRRKGESLYRSLGYDFPLSQPLIFQNEEDYLFDVYRYPVEWANTRSAWVRRFIDLEKRETGQRYRLLFEAVMPWCEVFVNSTRVTRNEDPTLPFDTDVTNHLKAGRNEIAVRILDYGRTESGRTLCPSGNIFTIFNSGIWQDVWLVQQDAVWVSDVTIRTSTRLKEMTAIYEFRNDSGNECEVLVQPLVTKWKKNRDPLDAPIELEFEAAKVVIPPRSTVVHKWKAKWPSARWWYPESPQLYWLNVKLPSAEPNGAWHSERFGFREVWIDGPNIYLNDYPVHLFSDWGHKTNTPNYTEAWIRKWFGMMQDANLNHTRPHTHPHPKLLMELADEEGILITGETALHGSNCAGASDEPEFWERAKQHLQRYINRDKNHPSIILWSIENEMRWDGSESDMRVHELPKLRQYCEELDPTRPAYHEGDSSLWDETTQPVLSRHYGKESSGLGWWDQKQPLLAGEMNICHYMSPQTTLQIAGDAGFTDYRKVAEAMAWDCRQVVEAGRSIGVSCFGPWNLSCLFNLRMQKETVELQHDDFSTPGIKPLYIEPHSCEFAFWEKGPGYTPMDGVDTIAYGFRPFAIIDLSQKTGYFSGTTFSRKLTLVNDTKHSVRGKLQLSLRSFGNTLHHSVRDIEISRGNNLEVSLEWDLEMSLPEGPYAYHASFIASNGAILDSWYRPVEIRHSVLENHSPAKPYGPLIAVMGEGSLKPFLKAIGAEFQYFKTVAEASSAAAQALVIESGAVAEGSRINEEIRSYSSQGGRVLVLEQEQSIFPQLELKLLPVLTTFRRSENHPVLRGLWDQALMFWGDDPYGTLVGNSFVASKLFLKDAGDVAQFILDSGEGGFHDGDLNGATLIEVPQGDGVILASQLLLNARYHDTPAAQQLLLNLLHYTLQYEKQVQPVCLTCDDGSPQELLDRVSKGETLLVDVGSESEFEAWRSHLNLPLEIVPCSTPYQAVRTNRDPVLNGISNDDTCGVAGFFYPPEPPRPHVILCPFMLLPHPSLEPLLESATDSCMEPMYVHGGQNESLRAHTASRFLMDEKPARGVILGRIRHGKGQLLLNLFQPPAEALPQHRRVRSRLLANLGHQPKRSLLEGDCVVASGSAGDGRPESIWIRNETVDMDNFQSMWNSVAAWPERLQPTHLLSTGNWRKCRSAEKSWNAGDLDLENDIFLYSRIRSPRLRAMEDNIIGPNPARLTFLEVHGDGTFEFILNQQTLGTLELDNSTGIFSDLSLIKGFNQLLIRWKPRTGHSTVSMLWRNIMRNPERDLEFS